MAPVLSKTALVNLNRDRQIVTRFQELQIRSTLPFLDFPPELRNMVYVQCLDTSGVEKFFERYYKRISKKAIRSKARVPKVFMKTPAILLVNRQIYQEAVGLLQKQSMRFDHGIFGLTSVTQVIAPNVLQQLSSLTITFHGHPILQENILRDSWLGQMDLIKTLSAVLAQGHKLKNLTIDIDDPDLTIHTTSCWHSPLTVTKCDFRDQLSEALNTLRDIRGVGTVTLKGFPADLGPTLKRRMESHPKTFFDLPGEIRNIIYRHSATITTVNTVLTTWTNDWIKDKTNKPPPPTLTTPNVLLLNKRITTEALYILRSEPLTLNFPLHNMQKQSEIPLLTAFITLPTLQNLHHLTLNLQTWEWIYGIEDLLTSLAEKHALKTFRFTFKDALKVKFLQGLHHEYPDGKLHDGLKVMKGVRGVGRVEFGGDLPGSYTRPLSEIMMSTGEEGERMPRLMAVRLDGSVVDAERND